MNRTGEPAILVTRAEEVLGEAWEDYARAVSASGGVPLVADLAAPGAIPDFDGLLVTAGVDVAPDRYGQSPGPYVQESNPERDRFEEGPPPGGLPTRYPDPRDLPRAPAL